SLLRRPVLHLLFRLTDPPPSLISTLSLHDALPISHFPGSDCGPVRPGRDGARGSGRRQERCGEAGEHPREPGQAHHSERDCGETDRKSTRLNSSHVSISYAVFCLKKKKKKKRYDKQ